MTTITIITIIIKSIIIIIIPPPHVGWLVSSILRCVADPLEPPSPSPSVQQSARVESTGGLFYRQSRIYSRVESTGGPF